MVGVTLTRQYYLDKLNNALSTIEGNYLEIGIYSGVTLCEFAKKYPNKKCYGIDPFIADGWTGEEKGTILTPQEEAFKQNSRDLNNVTLFRMTSKEFFEKTSNLEELGVSVVYIDGSHHTDDIRIDIDLALALIGKKSGFIAFDDLHINDVENGIKEAMTKFPNIFTQYGEFHTIN